MKHDGVSIAFQMILEEIEAVEAQLNHEGALAFKQSKYENANRLSATGERLGEFRTKLEQLREEWDSGIDVQTRARVKMEPSYRIPRHKKGKKTILRVTLDDGRVIQRSTAAQTMTDTIGAMGAEKVMRLGYRVSGVPLVGTEQHPKYGQTPLGRYLVCTHSNTDNKKEMLERVAKKLNRKITVEKI